MNVPHPPLPEPATFALVAGHGGSEFRMLSHEYDPTCAQYTAKQMGEYIGADRASRVPMSEAQLRELVPDWIGHHLVKHFELPELMRAVEAHHDIGAAA